MVSAVTIEILPTPIMLTTNANFAFTYEALRA